MNFTIWQISYNNCISSSAFLCPQLWSHGSTPKSGPLIFYSSLCRHPQVLNFVPPSDALMNDQVPESSLDLGLLLLTVSIQGRPHYNMSDRFIAIRLP